MSFVLRIRPIVTRETAEVYGYHEGKRKGLGDRFLKALREAYRDIEDNPLGYQLRYDNYRHVMVPGFRYRVVFEVEGDEVHVYQLRHTSRKPSKRFGP
jgi:plasmid stabilization system protein ParE